MENINYQTLNFPSGLHLSEAQKKLLKNNSNLMAFLGESAANIKSLRIDDGETEIGAFYFSEQESLEEVYLPKSITKIEQSAFSGCINLKKVIIEDGSHLEKISKSAFAGTAIEELVLPSSVKTIEHWAFMGCTNLKKINLQNVSFIGTAAFSGCTELNHIDISSCNVIGSECFRDCSALDDVVFPLSLQVIPSDAFSYCGFTKVNLASVYMLKICSSAFAENSQLSEVHLPYTLESIAPCAFYGSNLKEINIPDGCTYGKDSFDKTCKIIKGGD